MSAELHLCRGPDAGQLLGFLCSLGLLEAATRSLPERRIRLAFRWHDLGFRPVLSVEPPVDQETLVSRLHAWIGRRGHSPELTQLGKDLPCDAVQFEAVARELLSDGAAPALLAAFGFARAGSERIDDSAFRTMSGTGHQHFLDFARQIAEQTTAVQVMRCLFEQWTYEDPRPSLRFDPVDDRRYALRADNPANASSRAPIRTERAANAFAFEGLALAPVVPTANGPATTLAFRDGRVIRIRWPLWERPLGRDAAASLLASTPPVGRGVLAVFRARRLTVGKYRSFSPAERVA